MASRQGLAALAGALALAAAGVVGAEALRFGFYGTMLVAALVAAWLAVLAMWAIGRPRDIALSAPIADAAEAETIVLRALLDQAPGALLAIENGHVRALNRAARTLFATDDRVLPPPPRLIDANVTRMRHAGRHWRVDRVEIQDLGAARSIVALVDVEAEEHAAEARATRNLLRVLGHEVMNALAPIASLAESALDVLAVPERRDRLLPEILETLARRAEAYRQVGRLPAPTIEPVPIANLLAELGRLFDSEWQGRAILNVSFPETAIAAVDRAQLLQALLAITRNAAEAVGITNPPGTVRLSATPCTDRLMFHIIDDGPGIDVAHRASIFLPFFTTKVQGNGIGLTAARQIIQGHGGDIILHAGLPTTFEIVLPQ